MENNDQQAVHPGSTAEYTPEQPVPTESLLVQQAPISNAQVQKPNEPYDLDLDLLQPQSKKVRLNGKLYDVYPPRLKDLANLSRLAGQINASKTEEAQGKIDEMLAAFTRIMPGLKEDGVDLTSEQLGALFQFVNSMASPAENSALKAMGIEPTTEKKILPA